MPQVMPVTLTDRPADARWGDGAVISSAGDGLQVHMGTAFDGRRVRRAARQIARLGIRMVALEGPWDLEAQWAFSEGFGSARMDREVRWADLEDADRAELEHRLRVYRWQRQVVHATPEHLSPEALAHAAAAFLRELAPGVIHHEVISGEALREAGHVGTWNVGRGSDRPPALLELNYRPGSDAQPAVALVGKGITFDSGGYSIKESESMFSMKADMAGAATVTAALALAIQRGLDRPVSLFLCCAENLISGHAYKLGDIIEYPNGLTVEVSNTDAEGRLVLADGLLCAAATGAPLIVDAATLTGAALRAVGSEYNAIFCRNESLRNQVIAQARSEHELLWPLPLEDFHRDAAPSPYADTMNGRPVKGGGIGGASIAAAFLSRFVPQRDTDWVHLDLAGAFLQKGSDVSPAGATGHGIRTVARLLKAES